MRPLISEFSFGYALTEEVVSGSHGALRGAPVFPTQNQEGTVGGYDVELPFAGVPLFLQFKLSEYLSRRSAKEWCDFGEPYYRMHLRPLRFSDQHDPLLDWEAQGNEVYYVAPEFHEQIELNQFYLARSIVDNSACFTPADIGSLPDQYDHYVVFDRAGRTAWVHSDERRRTEKRFEKGGFADYFIDVIDAKKHEVSLDFLEEQNRRFLSFLDSREKEVGGLQRFELEFRQRARRSRKEAALFLSYLARTYFDAELIIIAHENNAQ